VQPHAPLPDVEDDDEFADALEPFPPWAANTENCTVCLRLAHFGHFTGAPFDITIRSCCVLQSSQTYS
jgi:hypothetical protein